MPKTIFNASGMIPGEQSWKGIESLESSKGKERLSRMLNFYSTATSRKDLRKDLVSYLKTEHRDLYNRTSPSVIDEVPFTAYKIARMVNIGMPINKNIKNHFVRMVVDSISDNTNDNTNDASSPEKKKTTISPLERIENKVDEKVLEPLDHMLDSWMISPTKSPDEIGEIVDVIKIVKEEDIPVQGFRFIYLWIDGHVKEFQEYIDGDNEYAKEYFSYVKKPIVRKWVRTLTKIRTEVEKVEEKIKQLKKKQRKKKKPNRFQARKQLLRKISKLKFLESSEELNLKSIDPENIYGSHELYGYNIKYNQLVKFQSKGRGGLDTRGTTVIEMDDDSSYKVKLRKPDEILDLFRDKNVVSKRKLENALSKVKTKKSNNTGRLNENTILLGVFNKK